MTNADDDCMKVENMGLKFSNPLKMVQKLLSDFIQNRECKTVTIDRDTSIELKVLKLG